MYGRLLKLRIDSMPLLPYMHADYIANYHVCIQYILEPSAIIYIIGVFEGGKGGIAPQTYFLPPFHKGTTISFTESLTEFCCFYALQHKIIL